MSWNYRAIKEMDHDEEIYRVYEVYYDKDGKLDGWAENPSIPQGGTLEELRAELTRMLVDVGDHLALDKEELRVRFGVAP